MSGAISPKRRHHIERLKRRWHRILANEWYDLLDLADDDVFLARRAVTHTPCSCPMCGNPRRHFGQPTIQERRADAETHAQLEATG